MCQYSPCVQENPNWSLVVRPTDETMLSLSSQVGEVVTTPQKQNDTQTNQNYIRDQTSPRLSRSAQGEDTLTPCDKSAMCDKFNILQVNISGIQNKTDELLKLLKENDVRIALIQETILPSHSEISTPGYSQHRCDCHKCQGIMTLIRLDTQAEVVKHPAGDLDLQNITVWLGKVKFTIYNVYWPNHSFKEFPLKETTYKKTTHFGWRLQCTPPLFFRLDTQFTNSVDEKLKTHVTLLT